MNRLDISNVKSHFPRTRIVFTWGLVFIGICIYSMFWFIFGWTTMVIIDAVEAAYTFEEPLSLVIPLVKNVVAWHPLIAMFGWLLYGYLDSMRRERRDYPI